MKPQRPPRLPVRSFLRQRLLHYVTRRRIVVLLASTVPLLAAISDVSAADATAGGRLYRQHCVDCHGGNGRGAMPGVPDIGRGAAQMRTDRELVQVIRAGAGTMPAYLGVVRDEELFDLVAYLRGFL